jgi:hypothetical protein
VNAPFSSQLDLQQHIEFRISVTFEPLNPGCFEFGWSLTSLSGMLETDVPVVVIPAESESADGLTCLSSDARLSYKLLNIPAGEIFHLKTVHTFH